MNRRERKKRAEELRLVPEKQHAVKVEDTTITFECPRSHRYTIDFGASHKLTPSYCRYLAHSWNLARGGTYGDCPKCLLEVGVTRSPRLVGGVAKRS